MEVMALSVRLKEEGAATVEGALKKLKVSTLAASAAIGTTFTLALNKLVDATSIAQAAQAQLENVIRTTGGAAEQTVAQLNAHAAALQKISTFGDEAINQAQARLLTYTGIVGDAFPRATEVVLDYAAAFKVDLVQASEAVGKALNYPTQGLGMLSKQGFIFTESQKAQIKYFEDTNQLAKAQAIIFDELESVTKGAAAAARDTLGGALDALKNAFGDLFEVSRNASQGAIDAIEGLTQLLVTLNNNMARLFTTAKALAVVLIAPFAARAVAVVVAFIGKMRLMIAAQQQTIAMAKLEAVAAANTARALALKGASTTQLAAAQLRAAITSRNLTLQTSLLSRAMVTATGTAKAMWVAIGGPIGAIVLALGGLMLAFDHFNDKMLEAAQRREEEIVQSDKYQASLYLAKRRREEAEKADANAGLTIAELTARQRDLTNQTIALNTVLTARGFFQGEDRVVRFAAATRAADEAQKALLATTEAIKKAQEEAAEAERKRLDNMVRLAGLTKLTRAEYDQLVAAEKSITAQLAKGNIGIEDRIKLLEQQKALTEAIAGATVLLTDAERLRETGMRRMADAYKSVIDRIRELRKEEEKERRREAQEKKEKAITLTGIAAAIPAPRDLAGAFRALTESEEMQVALAQFGQQINDTLAETVENNIVDGLTSGIAAALSTGRIADAWKAMSQAIIQNLASAMVKVALAAIRFGTLMEKIRTFMVANPALAVASAAAMLAFAYANGGKAQSTDTGFTGGRGGGQIAPLASGMGTGDGTVTRLIFGQTSATTAAGMTPRQATNVTIIGPDDPKAQRAIEELIRKGQTRGTLG